MRIISEAMHVMNQAFIQALEAQDKRKVAAIAQQQVDAGAEALDVNLGQVRKFGRLTSWLVQTIQEATEVPLFLSNHVLSQQRALEVHKGRATINAVTADPDDLLQAMKVAKEFQADLVVLLVSSQLTPYDVNGRLRLADQVLDTATKAKLPFEQLYLDPVITCRPDPTTWALSAGLPDIDTLVSSISMLGELAAPRVKTITALSNASVCLPKGKRSAFHCRLLPLLAEAGLDAVIMNCHDKALMDVTKNQSSFQALAA